MSPPLPKAARRRDKSASPGNRTDRPRRPPAARGARQEARQETRQETRQEAGQGARQEARQEAWREAGREAGTGSPGAEDRESRQEQAPRDEDGRAPLLPGLKPVLEILQSSPERVDAIFLRKGRHGKDMALIADLCRAAGVRFSLLDPPQFGRVYSGNSQGVVARLFEAGYTEWEDLLDKAADAPLPLILALDQVQDPGNAGTLARTLHALGGAGMVVPRHNGAYLGAAAAKASAGALDRLPVSKVANLGQALDKADKLGFLIYGARGEPAPFPETPSGKTAPEEARRSLDVLSATEELRLPAILVLGSEESGLRPGMEKRCHRLLHIPMLRDFNSLNVAQAGAIIISCFARQVPRGASPLP